MSMLVDKWKKTGLLEGTPENSKEQLSIILEKTVERFLKLYIHTDIDRYGSVDIIMSIISRLFNSGKITNYYHIDFQSLQNSLETWRIH